MTYLADNPMKIFGAKNGTPGSRIILAIGNWDER